MFFGGPTSASNLFAEGSFTAPWKARSSHASTLLAPRQRSYDDGAVGKGGSSC